MSELTWDDILKIEAAHAELLKHKTVRIDARVARLINEMDALPEDADIVKAMDDMAKEEAKKAGGGRG